MTAEWVTAIAAIGTLCFTFVLAYTACAALSSWKEQMKVQKIDVIDELHALTISIKNTINSLTSNIHTSYDGVINPYSLTIVLNSPLYTSLNDHISKLSSLKFKFDALKINSSIIEEANIEYTRLYKKTPQYFSSRTQNQLLSLLNIQESKIEAFCKEQYNTLLK